MEPRVEWQCPLCLRRFSIPAERATPRMCPECKRRSTTAAPSLPPVVESRPAPVRGVALQTAPAVPPAEEAFVPFDASLASAPPRRPDGLLDQILWLLDLRFERYLTPVIVRATWGMLLLIAALSLAFIGVDTLVNFDSEPARAAPGSRGKVEFDFGPLNKGRDGISPAVRQILLGGLKAVAVLVVVLYVRVLCEGVIVIFDIARRLKLIQQHHASDDPSRGSTR